MTTILEPSFEREPSPESSDRNFGYVFAAVFAIVSCWPLLHWHMPHWWVLAIAAIFALVAATRPQSLHPLNRVWLALGRLLHRVVSPIIMGLIFFLIVTPTGWIMRLCGQDLLSLKRRPELSSYWTKREATSPRPESLKNQF